LFAADARQVGEAAATVPSSPRLPELSSHFYLQFAPEWTLLAVDQIVGTVDLK
jgi:hypothetical protein